MSNDKKTLTDAQARERLIRLLGMGDWSKARYEEALSLRRQLRLDHFSDVLNPKTV